MPMKTKTQSLHNRHIGIVPATLILAALTLIFILAFNKLSQPTSINKIEPVVMKQSAESSRSSQQIESEGGLDQALSELDSQNPNTFNQDLNLLNSETAAF